MFDVTAFHNVRMCPFYCVYAAAGRQAYFLLAWSSSDNVITAEYGQRNNIVDIDNNNVLAVLWP